MIKSQHYQKMLHKDFETKSYLMYVPLCGKFCVMFIFQSRLTFCEKRKSGLQEKILQILQKYFSSTNFIHSADVKKPQQTYVKNPVLFLDMTQPLSGIQCSISTKSQEHNSIIFKGLLRSFLDKKVFPTVWCLKWCLQSQTLTQYN